MPMPLLPVLIALPCLLWTQGPESAQALKDAGVDRICVAPADPPPDWRAAGVTVQVLAADDAASRDALATPGIQARAGLGSPTRVPWVNANGWQYRRKPAGKFSYEVQTGRGALAAAEAFMYDGEAVLKIDPADLAETGRMMAFLRTIPAAPGLTDVADLAVVDDGGPLVGEVMNLLERRNLMFQIVKKPSPKYPINIVLGSPKYPQADAADPSGFALKIRHQLTDARRSFRLFGSEVVVARLTRNAHRLRLQLLNYSGRELQGLRVRVRGSWKVKDTFIMSAAPSAAAAAAMADTAAPAAPPPVGKLTDVIASGGATEFSVSAMGAFAVIDLTPAAAPGKPASKAATH